MVVPRTVKQSSYIFGETNAGSCFKSPPYHYVPGWLESRVTWVQSAVDSAIDMDFLQAAIGFRQIICTSHAEILCTNNRQLPK